jgi:hypothetical protein
VSLLNRTSTLAVIKPFLPMFDFLATPRNPIQTFLLAAFEVEIAASSVRVNPGEGGIRIRAS